RHLRVDAPDFPAFFAKSDAHLRFFAGDDGGVVSADVAEGFHADHRVSAAGARLSYGGVPFDVAQRVIDGRTRESLASPSAHHRRLRLRGYIARRALDPSGHNLA